MLDNIFLKIETHSAHFGPNPEMGVIMTPLAGNLSLHTRFTINFIILYTGSEDLKLNSSE